MQRDLKVAREIVQQAHSLYEKSPSECYFWVSNDLAISINRFHWSSLAPQRFSQIALLKHNGEVHNEKYPSHILFDNLIIILEWVIPKPIRINNQYNNYRLHRRGAPAKLKIGLDHRQPKIIEATYSEDGLKHNLAGPAVLTGLNGRLNFEWFFWGERILVEELRKIVKDPHKISKPEQVFLKLLYYKGKSDD